MSPAAKKYVDALDRYVKRREESDEEENDRMLSELDELWFELDEQEVEDVEQHISTNPIGSVS